MADTVSGNAEDLLRQWEDVAARRQTFQSVWQEIADNLLGRRDFSGPATPGRKRMARIYDTTGLPGICQIDMRPSGAGPPVPGWAFCVSGLCVWACAAWGGPAGCRLG